jgi:hypothetical protein
MFQLNESEVMCPYCGEVIEVFVDPSVSNQRYIEDCQVCCRPITLVVSFSADGDPRVQALHEDA